MPKFEPDGGKNDQPVTPEEYMLVRDGKGSSEQIDRVRAALANKDSELYKHLGASAPWARLNIERRYGTPLPIPNRLIPRAQQNFNVVIEYLRNKRDANVLTDEEVVKIIDTTGAEHLNQPGPTPSQYAMGVSRMLKAIIKLHPELEAEVKALPISRKR